MDNLLQEKTYLIAEDANGRLYFYINAKNEDPQKYPDPTILYDGKEHAILQRRPAQDILLDFINKDIRTNLAKAHSVTVVESFDENITQTYYANVEYVKKMPIEINL